MTTRDTVQDYFDSLKHKKNWETFLSEELTFTSFTNPIKHVAGKSAYLESTKRFFSMIATVELKNLLVEGPKACALTRYKLQSPRGAAFDCHVAEVLEVRDGKIKSLEIYFDSAPFAQVASAGNPNDT
jgi:ketosteroid isomerase-like protein